CSPDMIEMNQTEVAGFVFLEFQSLPNINPLLFSIFLVVYTLTLMGNMTIIALMVLTPSLKSPMYFFLGQLSLYDTMLTTSIAPKMLQVIINGGSTITITGCISQLYFYGSTSAAECLLLTVMSYDRYLAICKPLHYNAIMDLRLQVSLVVWSWFVSSVAMLCITLFIYNLEFCASSFIDHYYCELFPVLNLSCSEHAIFDLVYFLLTIAFVLFPFLIILFTYISICVTIFGISTTTGKQKSFSTCSSHLIVVSMYYVTLMTIYMTPSKGQLININKTLSLLYTTVAPFINPIIYSLRNQEIKRAFSVLISIYLTVN
uniref:Olfactory receptor n=1 Tax=Leptobrachium leishanense TaxID=445787 RepID=A0A8C5PNM8_9ANUR